MWQGPVTYGRAMSAGYGRGRAGVEAGMMMNRLDRLERILRAFWRHNNSLAPRVVQLDTLRETNPLPCPVLRTATRTRGGALQKGLAVTRDDLVPKLRSLTDAEFQRFVHDSGHSLQEPHSPEWYGQKLYDDPKWERKWAGILGLPTEEDKEMQATLEATEAAKRSAAFAERATVAAERSSAAAEKANRIAAGAFIASVVAVALSIASLLKG